MSSLPLHRLIAAAGGLVLPLMAGDAPATAAPMEHSVSMAVQGPAAELHRRDRPCRSAASGSLVSSQEADK